MDPASRSSFSPAGAGGVLVGTTAPGIGLGALDRLGRRLHGPRSARRARSSEFPPGSSSSIAATGSTSLDHRRHQPSSGSARLHARDRGDGSWSRWRCRSSSSPAGRVDGLGARRDALGREPSSSATCSCACARAGHLAASGVAAVGMMTRAIVVMGSSSWSRSPIRGSALAAAVIYALAYTVELASRSSRTSGTRRCKTRLFTISLLALALPGQASHAAIRPDRGVRAARVGPDPHRPARPLDHKGRRLPDARVGADDACSESSSCAGA